MIKVFIVDQQTVFRRGLAVLLHGRQGLQVVGDAPSMESAAAGISASQPDVLVTDVFAIGGGGVASLRSMQKVCPSARILVLTESELKSDITDSINAGARGYLLKRTDVEELANCVRLVGAGNTIVYDDSQVGIMEHCGEGRRQPVGQVRSRLTEREKEILRLVATGASNREIANQCYIGETTVKAHLRKISDKIEVKNRAQAVAVALETGLLTRVG